MTEEEVKQVIVVRKDLNMRKGKMAAQVAHASMEFILEDCVTVHQWCYDFVMTLEQHQWMESGTAKIVVGVDSLEELEYLVTKAEDEGITVHTITDEGRTEFHGEPTVTCAAFGPHKSSTLDKLTGHLKLL